eukprot:COSAG06_NODE_65433_length_257_cov_0.613924_1_plen_23_part_10
MPTGAWRRSRSVTRVKSSVTLLP